MTEAEQKLLDACLRGLETDTLAADVVAERIDDAFREKVVGIDARLDAARDELGDWFNELSAKMGGVQGDRLMTAARAIRRKDVY